MFVLVVLAGAFSVNDAFAQTESSIDKESVFKTIKQDVISKLTSHNGIQFYFEFERDFSDPDAYYQLYKIIDSRNNKHIGDLRIYLGSSEWWNKNALLQEDDTSGYPNIVKIKLIVLHFTDPNKIKDATQSFSYALKVLVPEWSSETSSVSSDMWFFDSINNAKRNDENKRDNKIIIENKEIRVIHDDIGFGSITMIITENFDVTQTNYVSDTKRIKQLFGLDDSSDKETVIEKIICGEGTVEKDGKCVLNSEPIMDPEPTSSGGGCLIATATYGSELAPQVQQLRELRDNSLLQTASGTSFMTGFNDFYYSFSPTIADWERENPVFKEAVKITLTPLISSLSILNYVDMDSEVNVLGYGISLILLNVGMYFVAPAVIVHIIKKKF